MRFKTLDGKEKSIDLRYRSVCRQVEYASKGQKRLRRCLGYIYKNVSVFEDFIIPGEKLSLDFFVPSFRIAFEFHGKQHYEEVGFFHKCKDDFLIQLSRDKRKGEWCRLNNIVLIEVNDPKIRTRELRAMIKKAIHMQNNSY